MPSLKLFRGNIADADLRLLRVFVAIVKAGGVTPAQVALNKSKSAVSMDLSALEERLGMTLCKRGRSGFSLTAQGEMVYHATLQLFGDLERYRNHINLAMGNLTGDLVFYVDDNFVFDLQDEMSEAIRLFSDLHPDIFLNMTSASPDVIEQAVLDGTAHMGMTALFRPMPTLSMDLLFKEVMQLYCGKDHPLFEIADEDLTLDLLRQQRFVDVNVRHDPIFSRFFEEMEIHAQAPTISSRLALVQSGAYLGFLPERSAARLVRKGKMRVLAVENGRTENAIYAIHQKEQSTGLVVRAFQSVLKDVFDRAISRGALLVS
ncbi:MAG: LysR family transcriptional regulator [Cohaesibacter sp.]|nr:LysR family transcriptional regulator [Cohaesibacter sp.]